MGEISTTSLRPQLYYIDISHNNNHLPYGAVYIQTHGRICFDDLPTMLHRGPLISATPAVGTISADDMGRSRASSPAMTDSTMESRNDAPEPGSILERLPSELLHQILSYLSARDLGCISETSRTLAAHGSNDLLWADLVNANLPIKIDHPGPFDSFRRLYASYYPSWFIPQSKIWFSDTEHTGNLILARYDNRRGVVEAFRILADNRNTLFQIWDWDPDVIILTFEPRVYLWFDDPIVLLKSSTTTAFPRRPNYLRGESRMPMAVESQNVYNAMSLCSQEIPSHVTVRPDRLWPPPSIPSASRVYRDVESHWSQWENPPERVSQICESAFRVRRWAHFRLGLPILTAGSSETLTTYATLDPDLYTPTREKPYQGIWVGDYEAHGCEFLLFLQRDGSVGGESHNEEEIEDGAIIQRGSLEAIKLTGDPNVPRGQISVIAEDIGPGGLVRIADESPFEGARIVKSRGHVAGVGFLDGTYMATVY